MPGGDVVVTGAALVVVVAGALVAVVEAAVVVGIDVVDSDSEDPQPAAAVIRNTITATIPDFWTVKGSTFELIVQLPSQPTLFPTSTLSVGGSIGPEERTWPLCVATRSQLRRIRPVGAGEGTRTPTGICLAGPELGTLHPIWSRPVPPCRAPIGLQWDHRRIRTFRCGFSACG